MPGIEPGAFHMQSERCTTDVAILEDRAFKKYIFTVAHYFVVMIRAEWSECFYFYQAFLLWKVSWLAQYKI